MDRFAIHYQTDANIGDLRAQIEEASKDFLAPFCHFHDGTKIPHLKDGVPLDQGRVNEQAEKVVDAIIGTRKDRLGRKPDLQNTLLLRERAARFMEACLPIEIRLTWVPRKRTLNAEDSYADLCELLCLSRLLDLHQRVQKIYPGGLHFNAFLIDLEGLFVEGDTPDVRDAMNQYINSLKSLVIATGMQRVFSVIRVSDTAPETEKQLWRNQLEDHGQCFFNRS